MRSSQAIPLFVIDTCPSDECQKSKVSRQSNSKLLRTISLPNCNETYKDLFGAIHYMFSNHAFKRSRSYPSSHLLLRIQQLHDKPFHIESPTPSIHGNMSSLDPSGGVQTPSCLSSRYSLRGSFVDLSESGYYQPSDQPLIRSNNRLLTINGQPLLIVDQSKQLSTLAYQDKCTDWLHHLNT